MSRDLPAVAYYERKTNEILRRYGPGPRVHYHTGLLRAPPSPGAPITELRRELVDSQEEALRYAAANAPAPAGDQYDLACHVECVSHGGPQWHAA